jgi:hypothetical protein
MFLSFDLLKMVELVGDVRSWDMMLGLHLKLMRAYLELAKGDPESMHLMSVRGSNNKLVTQCHEMLCMESHFETQLACRVI